MSSSQSQPPQKHIHFPNEASILPDNMTPKQVQALQKLKQKIDSAIEDSQPAEGKGSKDISDVRRANICWQAIGDIGALYIANCRWDNIEKLHLNGAFIRNRGCKILSKCRWRELRVFQLYQNQLDSSGVIHICKGEWPKIKLIHLGVNHITVDGLRPITKANWKQMTTFYIYKNNLAHEALEIYFLCEWPLLIILHTQSYNFRSAGKKNSFKQAFKEKCGRDITLSL